VRVQSEAPIMQSKCTTLVCAQSPTLYDQRFNWLSCHLAGCMRGLRIMHATMLNLSPLHAAAYGRKPPKYNFFSKKQVTFNERSAEVQRLHNQTDQGKGQSRITQSGIRIQSYISVNTIFQTIKLATILTLRSKILNPMNHPIRFAIPFQLQEEKKISRRV